jgi:hypothetical protein
MWRFLFYCDMSSGGGKLEKLPDLSPETEKIIAT